ncbi:SPFH domain-containing protein [Plastorhodobacter daqingensis]|uniref:SPFH domain-containing protein n=1 Tax=Plastorhodobacter daqingensis TaxID=1387281 RepID=A0ABW2UKL3_9RHOB
MSILNFLKGQLIDVIHWTDDSRDTMVWRFERYGHAINYGAKLTVRESQVAVFVHEGQLADVFGPGLYELHTNNMPVMTALQHWHHGFQSPFKAEVYFVSTRRFTDLKWGTRNPIMLRDPEFGPTRLRAFGTYAIRVLDAARFLTEIVGTDGFFTQDEVSDQIRNIIVQKVSKVLAASGIPVLDMAANTRDLSQIVAKAIGPTLEDYGLSMPELYIENISLPEAVEAALDRRTSMGIVGDLGRYTQFAAAEAMTAAARSPDGGMGAGLGAGMGIGMGMGMAGGMAAQMQGAATPPPPPAPPGRMWHIARNGETFGPFAEDALQQMAERGELVASTFVWTAGQDGWQEAATIPDLAALLSRIPPPPPKPGA